MMIKNELIMHIGFPKTGSTALQRSFMENRKLLLSKGIYYGECFSRGYHYNLYCGLIYDAFKSYCGGKYDDCVVTQHFNRFLRTQYRNREPIELLVAQMIENSRKNGCKKIIVSYERFIDILWKNFHDTPDNKNVEIENSIFLYIMKRIRELFFGFNVKIVCYIRRQDLFVESLFNEWFKEGKCDIYYEELNKKDISLKQYDMDDKILFNKHLLYSMEVEQLDYYDLAIKLAYGFGKENVIIKPFEKEQISNDIVCDFYSTVLNFQDNEIKLIKNKKSGIANQRFSRDLLEFKVKCIEQNIKLDAYWKYLYLSNLFGNIDAHQNYFQPKMRTAFLNLYNESNQKLAEEFLDREDGVLFYDDIVEREIYPGLSDEMFMKIFQELKLLNNRVFTRLLLFLEQVYFTIKGSINNNPKRFIIYVFDNVLYYLESYVFRCNKTNKVN